MKQYTSPELVAYGNLTTVTGVFGDSGLDDVFIDENGNDISDTDDPNLPGGSTDACASDDLDVCRSGGADV